QLHLLTPGLSGVVVVSMRCPRQPGGVSAATRAPDVGMRALPCGHHPLTNTPRVASASQNTSDWLTMRPCRASIP
ncbi:MAG TPA: hypothetical protein VFU63_14445, partial [Ktedonobacterales bacterium]|nr:hypothetical protein [Ktedonobacterales bacterium]